MKFNPLSSRASDKRAPSSHVISDDSNNNGTVAPSALPATADSSQKKGAMLFAMMEELQREMQAVRSDISNLTNEFQEVATEQGVQHKMFDVLHTELSDYKNDFVSARMKPMVTTMLFLYDAISGFSDELGAYVDPPDWLGERVLNKGLIESNLSYFLEQLDEIMRMCELQPLRPEVGILADPKMQNIIATEATEDANLDNQISKVTRIGWMQGERIFRPAEVMIWKSASSA